jgi:hypothetical protein
MRPCDFNAVMKDGECYCSRHFTKEELESDEVYPIFADSDNDYYPVCAECGMIHTYVDLTPDGVHNELSSLQDRYERIANDYNHPNPFNPNESLKELKRVLFSFSLTEQMQLETALEQFPKLLDILIEIGEYTQ